MVLPISLVDILVEDKDELLLDDSDDDTNQGYAGESEDCSTDDEP